MEAALPPAGKSLDSAEDDPRLAVGELGDSRSVSASIRSRPFSGARCAMSWPSSRVRCGTRGAAAFHVLWRVDRMMRVDLVRVPTPGAMDVDRRLGRIRDVDRWTIVLERTEIGRR
jgi:hypothetical protein